MTAGTASASVAVSLIGSGRKLQTAAFEGWLRPRGLASIVFALIAVELLSRRAGCRDPAECYSDDGGPECPGSRTGTALGQPLRSVAEQDLPHRRDGQIRRAQERAKDRIGVRDDPAAVLSDPKRRQNGCQFGLVQLLHRHRQRWPQPSGWLEGGNSTRWGQDMSAGTTEWTAPFWQSRRSAAIAGIVFSLLLIEAMIMMRLALSEDSLASLRADDSRRTLTRLSLNLVPFAGIASLRIHRCCQAVAVPPLGPLPEIPRRTGAALGSR
jgi:hypothetical protein